MSTADNKRFKDYANASILIGALPASCAPPLPLICSCSPACWIKAIQSSPHGRRRWLNLGNSSGVLNNWAYENVVETRIPWCLGRVACKHTHTHTHTLTCNRVESSSSGWICSILFRARVAWTFQQVINNIKCLINQINQTKNRQKHTHSRMTTLSHNHSGAHSSALKYPATTTTTKREEQQHQL